jgi:hypothetical protein
VEATSGRPPLQRSLSIGLGNGLPAGAENQAPALEAVLELGLGALDAAVAAAPRRGGPRAELQALVARGEAALEGCATEGWCAGLAGCAGEGLGELCALLAVVRRHASAQTGPSGVRQADRAWEHAAKSARSDARPRVPRHKS